MKPRHEAPHLLSAYRQLDSDGRRELVRRMMVAATQKLQIRCDDFDQIVPACLNIERTGNVVEKAAAGLTRMCVAWLESNEESDVFFAQMALMYASLDPVQKLGGGRRVGAVGAKSRYMSALVAAHPKKSAKALYKVALSEVDSEDSPFDIDADGDLCDRARGTAVKVPAFEKLVSTAKNSKIR